MIQSFSTKTQRLCYRSVLAMIFVISVHSTLAQQRDTTFFFKSMITVTNNGFSIIPAFTLGKPAGQLDMAMGGKRLTFEPQFRYSLEGRPWSFVFIYRYKIVDKKKFHFSLGTHLPGLNFIKQSVNVSGITENLSIVRRFIAAEVIATKTLTDKVNVGVYFLNGHAFQRHGPQTSYFLSLRSGFSKVKISRKVYFDFSPQLFYLALDSDDGVYVNGTLVFGVQNFPLSVSTMVNQAIDSTVPAKEFDWNVGLVYTLDKKYILK